MKSKNRIPHSSCVACWVYLHVFVSCKYDEQLNSAPPTHTHIFTVFHCPVDVLHYKTLCKPPLSCFQNLFMLTDALCGHLAGVSKMFKSQIEGGQRAREKHHQASLPGDVWLPASSHLKESSRQSNSGTFTFALHWWCHSVPDETFLRQSHEGVIFSDCARYDTLLSSEPFNVWK